MVIETWFPFLAVVAATLGQLIFALGFLHRWMPGFAAHLGRVSPSAPLTFYGLGVVGLFLMGRLSRATNDKPPFVLGLVAGTIWSLGLAGGLSASSLSTQEARIAFGAATGALIFVLGGFLLPADRTGP